MVRVHGGLILGLMALAGFMMAGCDAAPKAPDKSAADHDHDHGHGHDHGHDHAHEGEEGEHSHEGETYAMAVQEVTELNEKIRDAFAKDDMEAADKPLHELGHMLSDEVVALAEKAEITGDDLAAIKTAVKQLMDDFAKVDLKIHGNEGVAYSEVEKQVGDAIATLQKYVPAEK
jgi:ABC-type Zn2+ transport system substrate-binding protein/surface adhesin